MSQQLKNSSSSVSFQRLGYAFHLFAMIQTCIYLYSSNLLSEYSMREAMNLSANF